MRQNHLRDELRKYGYEFSMKKSILLYAGITAGMLLLGYAFGLREIYLVILGVWTVAWIPYFLRNACRNQYEQQQFLDSNTYMEQFLYSFQKSGKVLTTLEDVLRLFPRGRMHQLLEQAIDYMKHTYDEDDVGQKALAMIEEAYDVHQMCTIHRFALQVEKNGGEYTESILLMLDARRMWADRAYELSKEKNHKRIQIIISIFTSLLLCYLLLAVSKSIETDITVYGVTRVTTLLVLLIDFFIFYKADARLSSGYRDHRVDQESLVKDYQKVITAGEKQRGRFSVRLAKSRVTRGIQEVFPQWLMDVSLLLQSENVQVALQKSYDDAPLLIKPELKKMLVTLKEKPTDMEPYLSFMDEFTLPEIQSAMKMLYSISEGTGGNATSQIGDIIRRNQVLMDQAEKMKNEDTLAGMYVLFLAPQLTGGAKMLVDMLMMFFSLVSMGMAWG
jgi:hypothetical protein